MAISVDAEFSTAPFAAGGDEIYNGPRCSSVHRPLTHLLRRFPFESSLCCSAIADGCPAIAAVRHALTVKPSEPFGPLKFPLRKPAASVRNIGPPAWRLPLMAPGCFYEALWIT